MIREDTLSMGNVKDYSKLANGQCILKIVTIQVGPKGKTTGYKKEVGWSLDIRVKAITDMS